MSRIYSDLRQATRSLRRNWRFAAGVIATLGLGVGLGVPVLSLADHLFLRPPPGVANPDRVMRLILRGHGTAGEYFSDGLTGLDYGVMRSRATDLDGVAGWILISMSLGRGRDARSVATTLASASYFPVLGVRPFRGRFYDAAEDVEGNPQPPCVISYRFWKSDLAAAGDAVGRTLSVGTKQYTIVGIAPSGFNGLGLNAVDMWLPLYVGTPDFMGRDPLLWTTDRSSWLRMVARIKPGVSLAQATAQAAQLYKTSGLRTRDRELLGSFVWDPLQPGRSSLPSSSAKIALWLSAGGVLLLLLVTANLVNLFVARAAASTRQTAIRLAIGGGWNDLLRLQLAEALTLGTASAVVGLLVAVPSVRVVRSLMFPTVSWVRPLFDIRITGIAFGVALSVGAFVAAWTTLVATRVDLAKLLRSAGTANASGMHGAHLLRRGLLVVQAAVFAVLITGASAFVLSLRRASAIDLGFDINSLMAVTVPSPQELPAEQVRQMRIAARERVAALPEVESATLAYTEPWSNNTDEPISVPGSSVKPPWTLFDMATPEYLRTFGAQMRAGRWIATTDGPSSAPVVVINESLERVFWSAGRAVGQCMRVGVDSMPCRAIIGVVRDFHVTGGVDDPVRPMYYIPVAQATGFQQRPRVFFRSRGSREAAVTAVRRALQSLDPATPAIDVHSVKANVDWMVAPLRLGASVFTAFGLVAAIVGAVGLYSVLSFLVIELRRLHAIKLAVGATPRRLAGGIMSFAVGTVCVGLAIGFAILIPLAKILEPMLFHTQVLEPATAGGVVGLGLAIAAAGALAPVISVFQTDVMAILREQ